EGGGVARGGPADGGAATVRGFISDNISRSPSDAATEVGTVTQAFCSALQEELSDYSKLLVVLESYSLNPIPTPGSDSVLGSYSVMFPSFHWLLRSPIIKQFVNLVETSLEKELLEKHNLWTGAKDILHEK
ncbi:hypothetical protein ACJX0J_034225, partial [Zea mays]